MYETRKVTCGIRAISLFVGIVCALLFLPYHNWLVGLITAPNLPAGQTYTVEDNPSGVGPAYPAYWVTQDYWVAEGCPVSDSVKDGAEKILAPLDGDNISKTAIFCMPMGSVSVPGEYAKRFSKYYGIGNSEGDRKDNGFVWLVLYDDSGRTEIHYAVGDGLGKLGSHELGNIKRAAEGSYKAELSQTENIANAIFTVASNYNQTARANYEPWNPTPPAYGGPIEQQSDDSGIVYLCLGLFALLIWLTLISEPLLSVAVWLFGSYGAWEFMAWPLYVLKFMVEASANSSSSSSSSRRGGGSSGSSSTGSGKSTGGSTGTTRTR